MENDHEGRSYGSNYINTAIKRKTEGETKVGEKETEPHETTNCTMKKRLPYADKKGNEDETGVKIALIRQETQAEEVAEQYNKTCRKN